MKSTFLSQLEMLPVVFVCLQIARLKLLADTQLALDTRLSRVSYSPLVSQWTSRGHQRRDDSA